MDKRDIRRDIRRRLAALDADAARVASQRIFDAVERCAGFAGAATVAVYSSLADEPRTDAFIGRWSRSKRIVLPRIEGDGTMEFYDYAPDAMRGGAFGISEPAPVGLCAPAEIDFMIVPGVAFTADGKRLGRGKGFYDRYLSRPGFRAPTVGVCFAVQMVPSLPTDKFDVRVGEVVCY